MRVKTLKLENIGVFKDIELNFRNRVTVLLGTNSVGKTSILKSIFSQLSLGKKPLIVNENVEDKKIRTFKDELGLIRIDLEHEGRYFFRKINYYSTYMTEENIKTDLDSLTFPIPVVFTDWFRKIKVKKLSSNEISYFDEERDENTHYFNADIYQEGDYFQLWLAHSYQSTDKRKKNDYNYFIDKLPYIFPENLSIKFKEFNNTYEPIFIQKGIDVPLSYLSSGIQSILFLIYRIIADISSFYRKQKDIDSIFLQEGLVLIDEIDAHLHPEWQRVVIKSVTELFPKLQFIITSHSPLVASSCSSDQIIKLIRENEMVKAQYPKSIKGWLAEDILREIMGIESSRDIEVQDIINRVEKLYIKKIQKNINEQEKIELSQKLYNLSELLPTNDPTLSIIKYEALSKAIEGIGYA